MDRQDVKPPFAYYGGKTTLAPTIASLLPAHDHYVEPFAGSLAVLLAKKPSRAETVNDLDVDLVTFWRVLRDQPDELERVCALTPHARAELRVSNDLDVVDDVERARRVWVRLTQSRSHSMKPSGWWFRKAPAGHAPADYVDSYRARLVSAADRLRAVTLESRDALDVIADYGSEPSVCLYVDPPYLGETRATNYRVEMLDDDAHRAFALEALQFLVDALPRGPEQLRQVLLREFQADADLLALLDAVALHQQQQLLGQARRERLLQLRR